METLIFAVALIAAFIVGAGHGETGPDQGHSIEAAESKCHSVDPEPSVQICDPGYHRIIQRDLTVPFNQRVNEDAQ